MIPDYDISSKGDSFSLSHSVPMKDTMKLSICIPQYNRIAFLLKNLSMIAQQQYSNLEIVISDDCSSDNTEEEIKLLMPAYKYPIVYHRYAQNVGYDRNFRKSVELASGDYVIILGNDDTLNPAFDITNLLQFIEANDYPELGFTNFIEDGSEGTPMQRARSSNVLGTGYEVAMKYYSCFSFVGGLIYKKTSFEKFNSDKKDGSIYAQIYLGCLMIASGCRVFSLYEPYVIKDILFGDTKRNSYKDVIARSWKKYKVETAGLHSVIDVLNDAFSDANVITDSLRFSIFKRIYSVTYPFWLVDYRSNGALPAAVGLIQGLNPSKNKHINELSAYQRIRLWCIYIFYSVAGLLVPVSLFMRIKNSLYNRIKSKN